MTTYPHLRSPRQSFCWSSGTAHPAASRWALSSDQTCHHLHHRRYCSLIRTRTTATTGAPRCVQSRASSNRRWPPNWTVRIHFPRGWCPCSCGGEAGPGHGRAPESAPAVGRCSPALAGARSGAGPGVGTVARGWVPGGGPMAARSWWPPPGAYCGGDGAPGQYHDCCFRCPGRGCPLSRKIWHLRRWRAWVG